MKNFDESRTERRAHGIDFQIGGENFKTSQGGNPNDLVPLVTSVPGESLGDVLGQLDQAILSMVSDENDGHARWRSLRARADDPISLSDMRELVEWLIEQQTARPTVPPGDSSTPPSETGTASTDDSSSPESPEAQAA